METLHLEGLEIITYSPTQKCLHVQRIEEMLREGREILKGNPPKTDFYPVAIGTYLADVDLKAEFLQICYPDAFEGDPEPSIEPRALVAADVVIEALRAYDPHTKIIPDFNADPITQHLMSKIWPFHSWSRSVKTDDLTYWRKDFVAAYKAHAQANSQNRTNRSLRSKVKPVKDY